MATLLRKRRLGWYDHVFRKKGEDTTNKMFSSSWWYPPLPPVKSGQHSQTFLSEEGCRWFNVDFPQNQTLLMSSFLAWSFCVLPLANLIILISVVWSYLVFAGLTMAVWVLYFFFSIIYHIIISSTQWLDSIRDDMHEYQITRDMAQNRNMWYMKTYCRPLLHGGGL